MSVLDYTTSDDSMTEEELRLDDDTFLEFVALAFSKGTANVSPADMKKLRPLLRHYAKKKRPFTACVKDNRKRFGPLTEKYCAVIKDLIVGNTNWRGKGKKFIPKNLSEEQMRQIFDDFEIDLSEDFMYYLSELSSEDIEAMVREIEEAEESGEVDLAENERLLAEMFFEDSESSQEDGLIWKTILREGTWKFSPSAGQTPIKKPITVVSSGASDPKKLIISMEELKKNFEEGAIEHVTIPTSHADKVLENTGFIKALRFSKDKDGRVTLEAGHDFTEPDVKEKAVRGTVANTSAGILFDYIQKETGRKFGAVLGHVALTNRPWLNGMKPFGVEASEDLTVVAFSEEEVDFSGDENENEEVNETENDESTPGGEIVSTAEIEETATSETQTNTFFDEIGLSEDEVRESLTRLARVEAENKRNRIESKCKGWQEEGKSPALVLEAKSLLMADSGAVAINLSENGEEKSLSLSDVVERLMAVAPNQDLTEEKVNEEDSSGDEPEDNADLENKLAAFSQDEKSLYWSLVFDEHMSEDQAYAKVQDRSGKQE